MASRSQISSAHSLVRSVVSESRGALRLISDALFDSLILDLTTDKSPTVLILPGFVAPSFVYRQLESFLRFHSYTAETVHFGFFNTHFYTRQMSLLHEAATQFIKKHGSLDIVIGHSLGGVEAAWLLGQFPQIKKIFCIASPFNKGTSWKIIELGIAFIIPRSLQEEVLSLIVKSARPYAKKIYTIASVIDQLVPVRHAAFPDSCAANIVIDRTTVRQNPVYYTHTALPNAPRVREILLQELALTCQ